ncbi:hypothetical protein EV175_007375, partial [Coemansia sp. RSA 1933]
MAENTDSANAPQTPVVLGPDPSPMTSEERKAKLAKELEQIPLFMTQLPEEDEADNPAVEALRTM